MTENENETENKTEVRTLTADEARDIIASQLDELSFDELDEILQLPSMRRYVGRVEVAMPEWMLED